MRKIKKSWNPAVNLYREFKLGMEEGGLGDPSEDAERLKDASKAGKVLYRVNMIAGGIFTILVFVAAILLAPVLFGLMLVVFWHFHRTMKDHVKEHHKNSVGGSQDEIPRSPR